MTDNVLMTPFSTMVVPPPMSAYSLQLPLPVNHVTFNDQSDRSDLIAVLSNGRLAWFTFSDDEGKDLKFDDWSIHYFHSVTMIGI